MEIHKTRATTHFHKPNFTYDTELVLEAPQGYEFTGEYRDVKKGDYALEFADGKSKAIWVPWDSNIPQFILRKAESARERRKNLLLNITAGNWIEQVERIFAENPDEGK